MSAISFGFFKKKVFKRTGNLKMTLHGNWKNVGGAKKANQSCNLSEFGHPLSLSRKSKTEENWKLSTIIRQSKVSDGNWYFPLTAVSIMWRVSCLFPPPPGWFRAELLFCDPTLTLPSQKS